MNIKLIFRYYWPHVKKYAKSNILIFAACGTAVVGSGIASPLLYKRVMDIVSSASDPSLVSGALITTVLLIGANLFLYNIFYRIGDYALSYAQSHVLKEIADDAFRRIVRHSYEFFSNTFTGTLVARVRRYVNAFEQIQDQVVFSAWMNGLGLIFGFSVLTYFSTVLGGLLFAWFLLYVGFTAFFVKKKYKKDVLEAEANSKTTGALADAITNILNVKMFASHERELARFAGATDNEEQLRRKAWYFQNLQFTFQGYFIAIFEFVGMFAAASLWIQGSISAGTIILTQIYIFNSFQIVWNMGRNFTRVMRAFAEAKEMVDVFEQPIAVDDPKEPEICRIRNGEVEMRKVSFAYGKGNNVFHDFSLRIRAGEKVGLVGPSGAGKSTISKLLLRFADVQGGGIFVDGQNIVSITQDALRSRIAYVPQDPILFHRSLSENISYAKPNATQEEIISAAESAHAHEFISSFPQGYDTLVGERGVKLSGGERQRIALARAILKDAPILVLDEATSSLDSESEMYIQDALKKLMKGRTTIVIAHRLSTIMQMDRIVVIEGGKITEEGKHKELLKAEEGTYQRLWGIQAGGFAS